MRREYLTLIILGLAAIACNLPVGVVATPTVAPTIFALPSPSPTAVAILPSPTPLPSETQSPTPTFTLTATFTATDTPLPSTTPSATFTNTPTATDTPTNSATATPTFTDTAAPSATLPPTATSSSTPLPSLTPTPAPSNTATLIPPTTTLVPTSTPLTPTATQPPIDLGIITMTSLPTLVPSPLAATLVSSPIPVQPQPTVGAGDGAAVITATSFFIPARTSTPIFLNGAGGNVQPVLPMLPGGVPRGARDSDVSSTGRRAAIDPNGRLTIDNAFVPVKHPEKRVTQVRWSPDGRWLAYVVQTPGAAENPFDWRLSNDDGLWVFDTATNMPYFVLRQKYDNQPDDPQVRVVDDILWAANNDAIMVTLRRHKGKASIIVGVGGAVAEPGQYANKSAAFNVVNVVGGVWLPNDQGVVAATSIPEQSARLGIVYIGGRFDQIADGAALGLWIQNPALLPDGRYAFLGKPAPTGRFEDNPNAPLRLYVMTPGSAPVAMPGVLPGPVLLADWDLKSSPPHITVRVQTAQGISTSTLTVR